MAVPRRRWYNASASASKAQGLFEARLKQLKKLYGNKPIVLDPRIGDIPVEWWARN
jgi:hypothetical protein